MTCLFHCQEHPCENLTVYISSCFKLLTPLQTSWKWIIFLTTPGRTPARPPCRDNSQPWGSPQHPQADSTQSPLPSESQDPHACWPPAQSCSEQKQTSWESTKWCEEILEIRVTGGLHNPPVADREPQGKQGEELSAAERGPQGRGRPLSCGCHSRWPRNRARRWKEEQTLNRRHSE